MFPSVENFNMRIKKHFLVLGGIIVLTITCFLIIREHRLYDRSKPNIFEIPGTAYTYTPIDKKNVKRCYMVQRLPDSNEAIQLMVENYISENDIVRSLFLSEANVDYVVLDFYVPSMDLPVYFEENKNPFKLDDFIKHYKNNHIVRVRFDGTNSNGEYTFYDE